MMEQFLGPVLSLFSLLVDGLKEGVGIRRLKSRKEIISKIIEVKQTLDRIIENAEEALSYVEIRQNKTFTQQSINKLNRLLERQGEEIGRLLEQLQDEVAEELMNLFTPSLRRKIDQLITKKMDLIPAIRRILIMSQVVHLAKGELVVEMPEDLANWSHDRFMKEGFSYRKSVRGGRRRLEFPVSGRLEEQRKIVIELLKCSEDLSDYMRHHIAPEDLASIRRRARKPKS